MIDRRLRENSHYWRLVEKAATDGRKTAAAAWLSPVTAALSERLTEEMQRTAMDGKSWEAADQVRTNLSNSPPSMAEAPASVVAEFAKLLDQQDAEASAQWLWGTALGQAALAVTDRVTVAWQLLCHSEVAAAAFAETIQTALQSPEVQNSLLAAFEALVERVAQDPAAHVYDDERKGFRQILDEWKEQQHLAAVWNNSLQNANWRCDDLDVLHLLRASAPEIFLRLIERTELPNAVTEVLLRSDIRDDLDEIMRLLSVAPATMETIEGGAQQWSRQMTAPTLLTMSLHHARKLGELFGREDAPDRVWVRQEAEAHQVFSRVARALTDRPDGKFLALHWLAYLVKEQNVRPTTEQHWQPHMAAIVEVAEELERHGCRFVDGLAAFGTLLAVQPDTNLVQTGAQEPPVNAPISGTDAFLACAAVSKLKGEPSPDDLVLMDCFRVLMLRREQGLCDWLHASFPTWRHWAVAQLYRSSPDPVAAWKEDWLNLAEQRRRVRFVADERNADAPSFFLACSGLWLIDFLMEPTDMRAAEALSGWQAVFDAAYGQCLLQQQWSTGEKWREMVARLYAVFYRVLGGQPSSGEPPDSMASQLARLGGDDELLAWSMGLLRANGVPVRAIADALFLRGIDVAHRLQAFIEWEQRPGRLRPSSGLVSECRRLLSEIKPRERQCP